ncbi:uracil-DNA glycosylase [Pseudorhodobacter turbinis]|uniref:Type-4 uracil-DNA glycosylase n=1 Tax=Pseudorhodobacter turbinis TaxID=2500533 RepID=A0A4P8EHH7_9RHOB|nr:uracil-DNA glycosylase [Pseudorhodobacter turbinis]QCO56329.1 uracil-DNA glycosylase [Pseudorhodobacter turbinis]
MGIDTNTSDYDWNAAFAALAWQVELGVTEVMCEAAVDRYTLPEKQAPMIPKAQTVEAPTKPAPPDPAKAAQTAAASCADLAALRATLEGFEHCELKKGARNLVFAAGNPHAPLMVVGEAPGRDEDREGQPFVGRSGQLLDRMLVAIGHARDADDPQASAYLTNVLPWRPPGDRDPTEDEIAMMRPFLLRHIALANPQVIIAMGNFACQALLGQSGILRMRGHWGDCGAIPVMPMTHPAYLLRNHGAKRDAWADLLAVQAKLAAPS